MDVSKAANYHDFSGLAKLRLDAQQNSEDAIEPVARQFEGIFLQMMLMLLLLLLVKKRHY